VVAQINIDRKMALKEWHREALARLLARSERLLAIPKTARYIDPRLGADPSSGKPLYDEYAEVCDHARSDFPELVDHIPSWEYELSLDGSLRREDLASLHQAIKRLIGLVGVGA
jgi:hypothetical protein